MEAFSGVFTRRGEADYSESSPSGVFDEVFVKRGECRNPLEGNSDSVIAYVSHTLSDIAGDKAAEIKNSTALEISDAARLVVKNTFIDGTEEDYDSLKEFLQERHVRSCPAACSIIINDIVDVEDVCNDVEGIPLVRIFNTASSAGDLHERHQEVASKPFGLVFPDGVESACKDVAFNTASTFMDAEFDRISQTVPDTACGFDRSPSLSTPFCNELVQSSAPELTPLVLANAVPPAPMHREPLENAIKVETPSTMGEDRLKMLRNAGSNIQQQIHGDNFGNLATVVAQQRQQLFPAAVPLTSNAFPTAALNVPPPPPPPPPCDHDIEAACDDFGQQQLGPLPPPPQHLAPGAPPVLRLLESLPPAESAGSVLPNLGSAMHHQGQCWPCSFFHTRGCENGDSCQFCHLCGPGEKKKRLRARKAAQRHEAVAAVVGAQAILARLSASEAAPDVDFVVE